MDDIYKAELNRNVPVATDDEFKPIPLGKLNVWPPVVLAPMAGVTNWPFRSLCQRFGAGLYVSEMVTARPLVEGKEKTLKLTDFGPNESPRSLQIYGVDPYYVGEAVKRLVSEGRVDHIDMNFGCPVRKVTSKGGGSALPVKPVLLGNIVRSAVKNAGDVPVTIKFRMGIHDELLTYEDAGKIGEEEGCAAVALHARTAAQLYDGEARWEAIAHLKSIIKTIPVLGNGDIWEAWDALRMMRETRCDGVVVGRGCLGRPWLFRDLADVFNGREPSNPPNFGQVVDILLEHLELLVGWLNEPRAVRMFRKQMGWYTKGFRGASQMRQSLVRANTVSEVREILAQADQNQEFPPSAMRVARGKSSGTQKVTIPESYLKDRMDPTPPTGPVDMFSGG